MFKFFIKLCLFISVGVYPFIYVGLSGAPVMGCGGDSGAEAVEEEEDGNALATSDAAVSDGVSTAVTEYASSNLSNVLSFNMSPALRSAIKKTSSNGFECETEGDGASGTCTCPGGGTIVMDFEFDDEPTDDCEMPIEAVATTTYTDCQITSCGLTVTLNGTDTFSYGGTFNQCTMEAELTGGISTPGGVGEDCTGITATLSSGESATVCYDIDFEATTSTDFSLSGTFVISSGGATSEITFDNIADLQEQIGVAEECEVESEDDSSGDDDDDASTDDSDDDEETGETTGSTSTSYNLTITLTGNGGITGSTSGVSCSGSGSGTGSTSCTATASGALTLTATASTGSTFSSWGGACSGSSSTCSLTMDSDKSVTATFTTATSLTGFAGTYTFSNTSCTQSNMNASNSSSTLSGSNPYEVTNTGQSMSWLTINLSSSSCTGTTLGMGSCSSCSYTGSGSAGSQIIATCPVSMVGDTCLYTFTKQ